MALKTDTAPSRYKTECMGCDEACPEPPSMGSKHLAWAKAHVSATGHEVIKTRYVVTIYFKGA